MVDLICGNLLVITSRHHWACKPGMWMVSLFYDRWTSYFDAVVDDFGELVKVPR